jgi:Zn-dependent protease with chaperone function
MMTAAYFDGVSVRRHAVQFDIAGDGWSLHGDGVERAGNRHELVLAEPSDGAPVLIYLPGGAHCEIAPADRAQVWAGLGFRPSAVQRWQRYWPAALAAVGLLLALLGATVIWGIPAAAERVAQALPDTVDMSLGRRIFAAMEKTGLTQQSRLSDERIAEVEAIWRTVLPQHPRIPLRLVVRAMPTIGANAFALPDGTVLVGDLMVRQALAGAPDFGPNETAALAGVLAHEIGHIEHRHSARALARSSLTAGLSAVLFGDFSAVVAGGPAVLLDARHSRDMETDADNYAIAALRARHLSLLPLADVLDTMDGDHAEAGDDDASYWLKTAGGYLSSHPGAGARAVRLRLVDGQD